MDEQQTNNQPVMPQEQVQAQPLIVDQLSAMPSNTVGASMFSSKIIIGLIIIAVIVVGGISYYLFSSDSNSSSDSSGNFVPGNKSASAMTCKDLLSDDKFREIMGISDFQTAEEGRDRAVEGLNLLPGRPGVGDQVVENEIQQLVCSYAFTENGKVMMNVTGLGTDLSYTVVWGGDAPNGVAFYNGRNLFSQTQSGEFNGQTVVITPDPEVSQDVIGVGAAAYFKSGLLQVLSSNKNFNFGFIAGKEMANSKQVQENLAKIINSNLSAYSY